MENIEFYKKEMKEMFEKKNIRLCNYIKELDSFVTCQNCPLHKDCDCKRCDTGKSVDWLLEEHKDSIKLKQWEYDLLGQYLSTYSFENDCVLSTLKNKGHFKGVVDTSLSSIEILNNSEIVPDDYEFWE